VKEDVEEEKMGKATLAEMNVAEMFDYLIAKPLERVQRQASQEGASLTTNNITQQQTTTKRDRSQKNQSKPSQMFKCFSFFLLLFIVFVCFVCLGFCFCVFVQRNSNSRLV